MSNATASADDRSPEKVPRAKRSSPRMMQQMEASVRNRNMADDAFTYLLFYVFGGIGLVAHGEGGKSGGFGGGGREI